MRRLVAAAVVLGMLLGACSSDPTTSDEYQALVRQLTDAQQQLADVTADRDALRATARQSSERHDKAQATLDAVRAILDDPAAVGTEQEVVDALDALAVPGAIMEDAALGSIDMREGWYETLFRGTMDSKVDMTYAWLSEDGSQGGSLWLWHGTNAAGNPFELAGVNLDEFNEEGLITHSYVVYPYPDAYVDAAVYGGGT